MPDRAMDARRAEAHPHPVAVLDLGSNSFHMLIAHARGRDVQIVDKLREPVRLADGLQDDNTLSEESQQRALNCLERFAQRLRDLPQPSVRVVGTNTLRKARNGLVFRRRAAQILGHAVEVISGEEEARLIYQGVAHSRSDPGVRRLVVDIGGGSTEVIVGVDGTIVVGHSFYMGCVSYSRRYFARGKLGKSAFAQAKTHARLELRAARRSLEGRGWELVLGASGTCLAIGDILRANGWSDGRITAAGLNKLVKILVKSGHLDHLQLAGLRDDRRPVIAGGVAVLHAIFEELRIQTMEPATGALREGVLHELVGREEGRADAREDTVARLMRTYVVDRDQVKRVERTAMDIAQSTRLAHGTNGFDPHNFLRWAARLHETGLAVSFSGFHRHGAYIVGNSHMPGFARDDQILLAGLIRNHRRKIDLAAFEGSTGSHGDAALELTLLFRLAVLLNRSRYLESVPHVTIDREKKRLTLRGEPGWLDRHPLTRADLEEEKVYVAAVGWVLRWRTSA